MALEDPPAGLMSSDNAQDTSTDADAEAGQSDEDVLTQDATEEEPPTVTEATSTRGRKRKRPDFFGHLVPTVARGRASPREGECNSD